jgi:hypothetical protein
MKARSAGLFLVVFAIAGCDTNYSNPFQVIGQNVAPSAQADLVFLSSPSGTSLREIYALDVDTTAAPERLTFCESTIPVCDFVEVAPAPDRQRVVVRRISDANGDGAIQANEPEGVFVIDLARRLEGQVLADETVDSLEWTVADNLLLYSGSGVGGLDDLFTSAPDGTDPSNLTQTTTTRERHPRSVGQLITFDRAVPGSISVIWASITGLFQVTTGDPTLPAATLPGTDIVVGSDLDAEPSPPGDQIAFRRLTGIGADGRGTWDLMVVPGDGTPPTPLAVGGAFRGAPAWGPKGIVFVEIPVGSSTANLILYNPVDKTSRTLLSGAPLTLASPRWLPPVLPS